MCYVSLFMKIFPLKTKCDHITIWLIFKALGRLMGQSVLLLPIIQAEIYELQATLYCDSGFLNRKINFEILIGAAIKIKDKSKINSHCSIFSCKAWIEGSLLHHSSTICSAISLNCSQWKLRKSILQQQNLQKAFTTKSAPHSRLLCRCRCELAADSFCHINFRLWVKQFSLWFFDY